MEQFAGNAAELAAWIGLTCAMLGALGAIEFIVGKIGGQEK